MTQRPTPERMEEIRQLNKTERKFCELEHLDHCQEVEDVRELLIEIDALQADLFIAKTEYATQNTHALMAANIQEIAIERDRLKERVGKLRAGLLRFGDYCIQPICKCWACTVIAADNEMENAK